MAHMAPTPDLAAIVAEAVRDALGVVRHPDDILTEAEAAVILRCEVATLRERRKRGDAPPAKTIGRSHFYRRGDIAQWFAAQPVAS